MPSTIKRISQSERQSTSESPTTTAAPLTKPPPSSTPPPPSFTTVKTLASGDRNKCNGPSKCSSKKICVGFEGKKVYCYGSKQGCLWFSNDCTTDEDCKKYSTSSQLKYTDGEDLDCETTPNKWRADACSCHEKLQGSVFCAQYFNFLFVNTWMLFL